MTLRPTRAVSVGLMTIVLAVLPSAGDARTETSDSAVPHVRCLRPRDGGTFAAEHVLAAVRRVLRRRTLTNQSGTIHLTPGTYEVDKLLPLGGSSGDADGRHYRTLVRRRCGELVAERTWLVLIGLSQAQLVLPDSVFLFTPTPAGWRVAFER